MHSLHRSADTGTSRVLPIIANRAIHTAFMPPRRSHMDSVASLLPGWAAMDARSGEGFRTPAPWRTVVRGLGPAFESLPRRNPRAGRGAAWSGAIYGDLRI